MLNVLRSESFLLLKLERPAQARTGIDLLYLNFTVQILIQNLVFFYFFNGIAYKLHEGPTALISINKTFISTDIIYSSNDDLEFNPTGEFK